MSQSEPRTSNERKSGRFRLIVPCEIKGSKGSYMVPLRDISLDGCPRHRHRVPRRRRFPAAHPQAAPSGLHPGGGPLGRGAPRRGQGLLWSAASSATRPTPGNAAGGPPGDGLRDRQRGQAGEVALAVCLPSLRPEGTIRVMIALLTAALLLQAPPEADVACVELTSLDVSNSEIQQGLVAEGTLLNRTPWDLGAVSVDVVIIGDNKFPLRSLPRQVIGAVSARKGVGFLVKSTQLPAGHALHLQGRHPLHGRGPGAQRRVRQLHHEGRPAYRRPRSGPQSRRDGPAQRRRQL